MSTRRRTSVMVPRKPLPGELKDSPLRLAFGPPHHELSSPLYSPSTRIQPTRLPSAAQEEATDRLHHPQPGVRILRGKPRRTTCTPTRRAHYRAAARLLIAVVRDLLRREGRASAAMVGVRGAVPGLRRCACSGSLHVADKPVEQRPTSRPHQRAPPAGRLLAGRRCPAPSRAPSPAPTPFGARLMPKRRPAPRRRKRCAASAHVPLLPCGQSDDSDRTT